MSLYVYCLDGDCDFSTEWEGGTAAEDPAVEHAKETGHRVRTSPAENHSLERGEE